MAGGVGGSRLLGAKNGAESHSDGATVTPYAVPSETFYQGQSLGLVPLALADRSSQQRERKRESRPQPHRQEALAQISSHCFIFVAFILTVVFYLWQVILAFHL